ncbi:hypothetical protein ATEIFO6365_0004016900 [Aspergillus terreus]|uniref:ABM domain-containing protein n=1 Tax=Aspergillus terreus TaxID=33178 RepID=A0A5M3YPU8_ASPTE|nr:hypothetical protein ATETN484_0002019400 [Aspergillus terreus]GFF15050.1 hypothetical protein ATEIFO6365_0004016900 [Aspergillus terreus]
MSNSAESLSLHMTVYIRPENFGKFWEAFKPLYDNVIAEPECTFFEVYQSPEDPGTISWVENWSQSTEWLSEVQAKKPYYEKYFAITTPIYLKPREVKALNRVGAPYTMVKRANGGLYD